MITQSPLGTPTAVDAPGRILDGICVPYDELSYFTPNPAGERVLRGAFAGTDPSKIFLFRGHDRSVVIGHCVSLSDQPDGLHGTFRIRATAAGDGVLADLLDNCLPAMSIGFRPVELGRGPSGETVVIKGQLKEVSVLPIAAYDGARVLSLRGAQRAPERPQGVHWHVAPGLRSLVRGARFCTAADPCEARAAGRGCR